ncbi:pyruvate ferredoxin oxidoreductase [Candidatus Bathyarchaeota archaeon]|nr:MAG: pyruvate ferredoxin oxidoreductase [Candidatus Bathyarchaeota archaeon]
MPMTKVMEGNEAAAYGVKLSRVEVIAAYPITPQTELISTLASMIARGELKAEYIKVEGEHTALAATAAASAAGARAFTASAAQGIVYMEESIWMPPGMRLPVVMCIVNRAIAPLGGLRPDHNDSLLQRDTGWIQIYCENGQEVLDTIIQAYRIGEDKRVYLPVAPCYEGYVVSATATPVEIPDQEEVDDFLPPYKHEMYSLYPENPRSPPRLMRSIAEARYEVQQAMERAKKVIEEVDREYGERFGRYYDGMVEQYRCEDAEAVMVTMGSITGTARDVVDELREEGKKIGLVKLRVFRPFPTEEIQEIGKRVRAIGFVDRNTSYGAVAGCGIGCIETARALYPLDEHPLLLNYFVGLGGSDVTIPQLRHIAKRILKAAETGKPVKDVEWVELEKLEE